MKFYFFGGNINMVDELIDSGFDGNLFLYQIGIDQFTTIARKIDPKKDFKYMIAIRPYVISPQYLWMINNSLNQIAQEKIQINLISGSIREEEKDFGGILGNVNDVSSNVDRSNYLIEYLNIVNLLPMPYIDIYVSTTNKYTFDAAMQKNNKVIVPYSLYTQNIFDLAGRHVMISIGPILRNNVSEFGNLLDNKHPDGSKYFTIEEFENFIKDLEHKGINEIIIYAWPDEEKENIISFIKNYKKK